MTYKIFDRNILNLIALQYPTPCYIYDSKILQDNLDYAKAECELHFAQNAFIHYALKANNNPEIMTKIRNSGFGIDCVSGGEIEYAVANGFSGSKIVFAGVGKQDWEIDLALNVGVYAFNCESLQEVEVIHERANLLGKIAPIMLRVNPDIDAKTHRHISTGMYDNKFGITFSDICDFFPKLRTLGQIKLLGLHYHIGSQITDMNVFAQLGLKATQHYAYLANLGVNCLELNLGGGLGIDYINPEQFPITDFAKYFATIRRYLKLPNSVKIRFELGRSLVAQCGIILSKVLYIKNTAGTQFAIIDAGMNDLMRPALYDANHVIVALKMDVSSQIYHVVGPICESADIFAKNLKLPKLQRGDVVIILSCGAYGHVLANQYNRRNIIKEYMI